MGSVERITALEVNQNNLMKEISEIKADVKELLAKFENLDNKYATKSSVNRIWVIIWSIIGFFATAG